MALYRKYRSQTFDDLVGQDHVVKTLRESIKRGGIAQAYLFTGPRGTGKTSVARLLAKALNAEGGPNADFDPDSETSRAIADGSYMDVLEMDAASEAGVDEVREKIVEASEYRPAVGRYRVFIIDEVHDLSAKGFDALLKTIEEPPEHAVFVLATTAYHKVPPTIRSRCQRFDFARGTVGNLTTRLKQVCDAEGIEIEPAALGALARMADGGYRDALTLLEQAAITADGAVTEQHVYEQLGLVDAETADTILTAVASGAVKGLIESLDRSHRRGRDPRVLLESLLMRLSELSRTAVGVESESDSDAATETALRATAAKLGSDRILELRGILARAHTEIRDVSLPRIWLESQLLRIAAPQPVKQLNSNPQPEAAPAPPTSKPEPRPKSKKGPNGKPPAPPQSQPQPQSSAPEEIQTAWKSLYDALAAKSRLAREKLDGSYVESVDGEKIVVILKRRIFAEWIAQTPKVQQAIHQQWRDQDMSDANFEFKSNGNSHAVATVESPLQGSELQEAAKEVFGVRDEDND